MTPKIMYSELTGRYYIVTAVNKDGSAKKKYDCTDQIKEIIAREKSGRDKPGRI